MSHSIFEVAGLELTVYKAPANRNKAIPVSKIVIRDHHYSYTTPAGDMFSSRVSAKSWYIGRRWQLRNLDVIEDAILLGVLPSTEICLQSLKQLKTEEANQQAQARAAENIIENAQALGLKFTKVQLKLIKRIEEQRQQQNKQD